MQVPALPQHVRPDILRRLNALELLILCERYGAHQIAARLGVDLATAIQQAATKGQS